MICVCADTVQNPVTVYVILVCSGSCKGNRDTDRRVEIQKKRIKEQALQIIRRMEQENKMINGKF